MKCVTRCLWSAMALSAATASLAGAGGDDPHQAVNPLYQELLKNGLEISGGKKLPFPAPILTEAMDAKAQEAALTKLAGDDYPLEELLRDSIVAPHVYKFRTFPAPDKERSAHAVDLWFVVHGKLDKIGSSNVEALFFSSRKETKTTKLDDDELKARGITPTTKAEHEENYVFTMQPVLDRVQVQGVYQSVFTRKSDSLVLASRMDGRFADDKKFANRWRAMSLDDDAKPEFGPFQPYDGVAVYLRLTRLKAPANAFFVEFHQVFIEPRGWFDGANLLRSKLPIVLQNEARAFRREVGRLK